MNIELKVSAKQSDIPSGTMQRLRRTASFLSDDNIEVNITFGDDPSPQEEYIDPTIDQYPNLTKSIILASQGIKTTPFNPRGHKVA